jgi:hypothetical protein
MPLFLALLFPQRFCGVASLRGHSQIFLDENDHLTAESKKPASLRSDGDRKG